MRKILFAVLAAVASAASHKGRFVSVSEEIPILFDAEPAQAFQVSIHYDFDFGYAVQADQTNVADDGINGPLIVDNWAQFSLWSDANIGININLMGLQYASINLNIVPFEIIPIWFSIYNTHPYRLLTGDALNIFTEAGYGVAAGAIELQYLFSSFLPKVSLYDALVDGGDIVPVNAFTEDVADINDRTDAGWAYTQDSYKSDPYYTFNVLDYLLDNTVSMFVPFDTYFSIDIVGDSTAITL